MATTVSADGLELLVEPRDLYEYAASNTVRIIDARSAVSRYRRGHIPGAVFIPRKVVYDRVDGVDGRLPPVDSVISAFEEVGIGTDFPVVIYDGSDGLWASRIFWALEYLGHSDVHVLNGGIAAWQAEGYDITREASSYPPARFEVRIREDRYISSADMIERYDAENQIVIDARSPAEYNGKKSYSKRNGRIPGAQNIDWEEHLQNGAGSAFLSLSELADLYERNGVDRDRPILAYCQAGVRASHTYFILRFLGYERITVYDDSWEYWGNVDDTPVER